MNGAREHFWNLQDAMLSVGELLNATADMAASVQNLVLPLPNSVTLGTLFNLSVLQFLHGLVFLCPCALY